MLLLSLSRGEKLENWPGFIIAHSIWAKHVINNREDFVVTDSQAYLMTPSLEIGIAPTWTWNHTKKYLHTLERFSSFMRRE